MIVNINWSEILNSIWKKNYYNDDVKYEEYEYEHHSEQDDITLRFVIFKFSNEPSYGGDLSISYSNYNGIYSTSIYFIKNLEVCKSKLIDSAKFALYDLINLEDMEEYVK